MINIRFLTVVETWLPNTHFLPSFHSLAAAEAALMTPVMMVPCLLNNIF